MLPDFFITGPRHSGTTLVSSVLSEDPGMFVVVDSLLYPLLERTNNRMRRLLDKRFADIQEVSGYDERVTEDQAKWFLAILTDAYFAAGTNDTLIKNLSRYSMYGHALDVVALIERVREGISWRELFHHILDQLIPADRDRAKLRLIGEKTPANIRQIDQLIDEYPERRFIIIVRHPIDNVCSIFKRELHAKGIAYNADDPRVARILDEATSTYLGYADQLFLPQLRRDNVLHIRFEAFLDAPGEALSTIHRFLDFQPSAEFDGTIHPYLMEEFVGHGIDKRRSTQAREMLTDADAARVSEACARVLDRYHALSGENP